MLSGQRKVFTLDELSHHKGKFALIRNNQTDFDICKIKDVVCSKTSGYWCITVEKPQKKGFHLVLSNVLDVLNLNKWLPSVSSVSHVPISRVYPLIDVISGDEILDETQWQTLTSKNKSKNLQTQARDCNENSLVECCSDKLKSDECVLILDEELEPIISGKVRTLFKNELNVPPFQYFVDVLVERRITFKGRVAQMLPKAASEFNWHLLVESKYVKKLGEEIPVEESSSCDVQVPSTSQQPMNTEVTSELDYAGNTSVIRRNTLEMLEKGKLFRACFKYAFGSDFKWLHQYGNITDTYRWNVSYVSSDDTKHSGHLLSILEMYSEVYFHVTFSEHTEELKSFPHERSCSGGYLCAIRNEFLVNEKYCSIQNDACLLVVKTFSENSNNEASENSEKLASSSQQVPTDVTQESNEKRKSVSEDVKLQTSKSKYDFVENGGNEPSGIEAGLNSCYLDSTLFVMFRYDNSFDDILMSEKDGCIISASVIELLKNIAYLLRQNVLVPSHLTNDVRQCLSNLNPGFLSSFMDVEELFSVLFKDIFLTHPFELNNGGVDVVHQLLVPAKDNDSKDQSLAITSTQVMLERSFSEYHVKFVNVPHPVLMLKLPYCDGKAYFGCNGVIPSKFIKLNSILEPKTQSKRNSEELQMELYGVICLKSSHYTCFAKTDAINGSTWVYFDSASRYKPQITTLKRFEQDLEVVEEETLRGKEISRNLIHQKHVEFLLKHIYLCLYRKSTLPMN